MSTTTRDPDELLLGFTRALRAAGVAVTQDRAQTYLRAVALLGLQNRSAAYWAGQATLCSGPDDLDRYDQVFGSWFLAEGGPAPPAAAADTRTVVQADLGKDGAAGSEDTAQQDPVAARASTAEVLRHRDIADLSAQDKAVLASMFATLCPRAPRRTATRHRAWRRGELDTARTLRRTLARMGEPGELAWRHRGTRPRRLVLLVDVSGSMSGYADALLRLAHTFVHGSGGAGSAARQTWPVEVFTIGTRLTHVTRALRSVDADRAIVAAGRTVPDWSGGTRLGETVRVFLDRWGQRGLARGAVVVVFSDGWERGDATLLAEQMRRLARLAHRVVWVNPHRGKGGYRPVQQGMAAALPHVDDFVAGHSMQAFAELVEMVARA